jgi:outer membrane lipoprotein-sorting protein
MCKINVGMFIKPLYQSDSRNFEIAPRDLALLATAASLLLFCAQDVSAESAEPTPLATSICSRAQGNQIENFSEQGPLLEGMIDGRQMVDAMHQHASELNDYSLGYQVTVFKKQSTVKEKGNLYFKKPQMLRLEETGQYKKGSVAVIGKDGKARAHAGGFTKFITVTLAPDDDELVASNGEAMKDSDLASQGATLQNLLKQGVKARASKKPIAVKGVTDPTYVLELYRAETPQRVLKRIFLDPITFLPVRWDDYDIADPSVSTWTNVKTNIGLKDQLFTL